MQITIMRNVYLQQPYHWKINIFDLPDGKGLVERLQLGYVDIGNRKHGVFLEFAPFFARKTSKRRVCNLVGFFAHFIDFRAANLHDIF